MAVQSFHHRIVKQGDAMGSRRMHLIKVCGSLLALALLERLAYSGVSSDLQIYLTSVLGMSTVDATAQASRWLCMESWLHLVQLLMTPCGHAMQSNAWQGTGSCFALLGGFIADAYLGRGKVKGAADVCRYLVGWSVLCVQSLPYITGPYPTIDCSWLVDDTHPCTHADHPTVFSLLCSRQVVEVSFCVELRRSLLV